MKVTDFFLDGQTLMLFRAGHRKVLPTLNSDMLFCKNYYLVKKTMSDFFKEKKRTDFLRKKATERSELGGHDVGKKTCCARRRCLRIPPELRLDLFISPHPPSSSVSLSLLFLVPSDLFL